MHPLDGPRLKVRRAKSGIERLTAYERAFQKDAKYQVVRAELNPKTGYYAYRVRGEAVIDPLYGVWLGEIAHNLRSALDQMVWQVALLNPRVKTPAGNTQFPIFLLGKTIRRRSNGKLIPHFENTKNTKGKIILGDGRHMIRDLLPKHQTMIKWLQPYKTSPIPKNAPLYLLSEINNADKHRLLQVAGTKIGAFTYNINNQRITVPFIPSYANWYRSVVFLKDGAKVFQAAPGVQVAPSLIPQIAFWEGCDAVRGKVVEPNLRLMARLVSDIIERFAPGFE